MGVIIEFDYSSWVQLFPEFAYIDPSLIQSYFAVATNFVRNDGDGPVNNVAQQTMFLNYVTAHITKLFAANPDGSPSASTQLVGRISSASEGSVSVSTEFNDTSALGAYFNQTEYGATFWAASRPYRTMRWIRPLNQRVFNPYRWRF